MTPGKLLIAQRLDEHAREGTAIVALMGDYITDRRWAAAAADTALGADLAGYWAENIRLTEGEK